MLCVIVVQGIEKESVTWWLQGCWNKFFRSNWKGIWNPIRSLFWACWHGKFSFLDFHLYLVRQVGPIWSQWPHILCMFRNKKLKIFSCHFIIVILHHTNVACAVGPSVITSSTDISFQNLVFWNLFEFWATEITWKSISPIFWIQILPNKFH